MQNTWICTLEQRKTQSLLVKMQVPTGWTMKISTWTGQIVTYRNSENGVLYAGKALERAGKTI